MGKQFRDLKSLGCESAGSYSRDKSTQEWKGKVLVVKEAAGRRMSDVEYGGNWEFMHPGRMQELLRQVIKDGSGGQG